MFGPLISVLAVILGLVLVGPISPASSTPGNGNNDECVPSDAVAASFGPWTNSGDFTDPQLSDTAPDPDGQSGDDNPLNLKQAGAIDQRTVTDEEATDTIVVVSPAVQGQHYSLKGNSGIGVDEIPPTPDEDPDIWQANSAAEPPGHYNSTQQADDSTYVAGESGLHYASHGSDGLRDWFYYQAPQDAVTRVKHKDAVTHTEYRWAIQSRTYTPAKDAVTCEKDKDPKGSNGHVKVDDDNLDGDTNNGHGNGGNDNGNGNDPHLNCTFNIEWYGYDTSKDIYSTVNFIPQAPTADTTITVVSGDTHPKLDSNGGWVETYTLGFSGGGDPQHNHGYHVMITIDTEGTIGADQKHKVFWVEGNCGETPEPTTRTEHHSVDNCDIGGFHTWDVLFTTTYAWDEEKGEYVGTEDAGVIQNDITTPYTHDQAIEHGCTSVPEPTTRTEHYSEDGCEVGGVHTWDVVYTTTYAWDEEKGEYVGTEDAGVIENDVFTVYTHDQQVELGCTTLPEPLERVVHQSEESCDLGGVHSWDDVYTTTFSWDEETGTYIGTETGPVAENDVLTPYTAQQAEDLGCIEVEGEQTHGHHGGGPKHHPEVKGEQAHAPAAAVVPTQVEAGLAGTPAGIPAGGGSNNLPLWALSLGAGMFLIGAGRLRRTSRATR